MSRDFHYIGLVAVRMVIGLLFLVSGIGKLMDGSDARFLVELMAMEFYFLIEYTNLIVITFSFAEIIIAVLLLSGRYVKWALSSALILLIFFTSILGYFYIQGQQVESCGCFGAFGGGGGLGFTMFRNLFLAVLIASGFYLLKKGNKHIHRSAANQPT